MRSENLVHTIPTRTTRIRRQRRISSLNMFPIPEVVSENTQAPCKEVFVVGGGPSLIDFDFSKLANRCTIVVNKSILYVPNPNYFISVDYTFLRKIDRSTFSSTSAKKFFVADLAYPFLKEDNGRIVDTRYDLVYNLAGYDMLVKAYKQEGIGYAFKDFRTGKNSGFCALQLAIIFGFTKIYLLGMGLNKREVTHYHGGYGEKSDSFNLKLDMYYDYFEIGLKQLKREKSNIQVISCSPNGRLNCLIPYMDPKKILS